MRVIVILLLLIISCTTGNKPEIAGDGKPDSLGEYPFDKASKIIRGKLISKQQAWSDISKTEISHCIEVITVYKGNISAADTLAFRLDYNNDSSATATPVLETGKDYIIFFTDASTGSSSCGGAAWHKVYELVEGAGIKAYEPAIERQMQEQLKKKATK